MLVIYKGNFNDNPSVNFRGQAFEPGKPVEVTQEWFDNCQEMCEVVEPKPEAKEPQTEEELSIENTEPNIAEDLPKETEKPKAKRKRKDKAEPKQSD